MPTKLTILGAGPAGLSVGYFAKQKSISFALYEALDVAGGNCRTIEHKGFYFDSGAHRFHDKDEEVTRIVKELLGDDLRQVRAPSSIHFKGKKIDFPLSPLNVFSQLGLVDSAKAGWDYFTRRQSSGVDGSFEARAIANYGETIANNFLLNYSQKLWGVPCDQLLPETAGQRLKGLNFSTFVKEAFQGKDAKTEHIDGAFYYPKEGYGTIVDKLAQSCGEANLRLGSKVTSIYHSGQKIEAIEINGEEKIEVETLLSSIPLGVFLSSMQPKPPEEVLDAVKSLKFRNLVLVIFLLDKEAISNDATTYYPEKKYPFTRVYEPRNRSAYMAPKGKTSLVVEIPCWTSDDVWVESEENLTAKIKTQLLELGLFEEKELISSFTMKMPNAYPVLENGIHEKLKVSNDYLSQFENLTMLGRNGLFQYTHLHDMIKLGKKVVEEIQP